MKHKFKTVHTAFTLAEVLITLSILGIIAAMTIPTTMTNIQEKVIVTKLKKVYAQLNQSFQIAVLENGTPDEWGLVESTYDLEEGADEGDKTNVISPDAKKFLSIILSGLKVEDVSTSLPPQDTNYLNNKDKTVGNPDGFTLQPYYRLPDGTIFFQGWVSNNQCSFSLNNSNYLKDLCGDLRVDLNGAKKPNVMGIDQFQFRVGKNGIFPMGMQDDTTRPIEIYCNPSTTNSYNGYACAAWVLEKGTMPWLHGEYISWDK